jgi:hypothetical protein
MGFSLSKDKHLTLYITLNKSIYYAGEMVEGAVHINCSADRPYRFLNLIIEGYEEVKWNDDPSNELVVHYN